MSSSHWDSTSEPHLPISGPVLPPGGGYGLPMPYHDDPVIMAIGDIAVTRTAVIVPTGRYPLRGTTWTVQDSTQVSETIPAYAIVLVVIFFFTTQFPPGPHIAGMVTQQVNQARALAAVA